MFKRVFCNKGEIKSRFHIDDPQVICINGTYINSFNQKSLTIQIDISESIKSNRLIVLLPNEIYGQDHSDEICSICSTRLLKLLKQRERTYTEDS